MLQDYSFSPYEIRKSINGLKSRYRTIRLQSLPENAVRIFVDYVSFCKKDKVLSNIIADSFDKEKRLWEDNIKDTASKLLKQLKQYVTKFIRYVNYPSRKILCKGMLRKINYSPEKKLEEIISHYDEVNSRSVIDLVRNYNDIVLSASTLIKGEKTLRYFFSTSSDNYKELRRLQEMSEIQPWYYWEELKEICSAVGKGWYGRKESYSEKKRILKTVQTCLLEQMTGQLNEVQSQRFPNNKGRVLKYGEIGMNIDECLLIYKKMEYQKFMVSSDYGRFLTYLLQKQGGVLTYQELAARFSETGMNIYWYGKTAEIKIEKLSRIRDDLCKRITVVVKDKEKANEIRKKICNVKGKGWRLLK